MRKIISILVALGLVLAFSATALPATAANTCSGTVTMSNDCAGEASNYTINFTAPVTLTPGNDLLSFTFGDGTSLANVGDADITVNATAVTGSVKSGTHIEFPVPAALGFVMAGTNLTVVINDVVNPAGGDYVLTLDYQLVCCDAEDFCTVDYTIKLAEAEYGLKVDFGPTYPGIAEDFVPPFKACGQNDTDQVPAAEFDTVELDGIFFDQFDLIVEVVTAGCDVPCDPADLFIDLIASPSAAAVANISVNGTFGAFNALNSTVHNVTIEDFVALNETTDTVLDALLHFDTKGDYTIMFKVICPGSGVESCLTDPPCVAPEDDSIATKSYDFSVYQWKDAIKLTLDEKWNLVSLPLVPLVDPPVDDTLASIATADLADIMSVWHYDACSAEWFVWPTPVDDQQALTELVDGEGYWVYVDYPQLDCGNITWWIWGTENAMPPEAPAQYAVCEGWNQIGFTSMVNLNPDQYLWNWTSAPVPVVYGWGEGCWTAQTWNNINFTTGDMEPGKGYWVAFPSDGAIYVP